MKILLVSAPFEDKHRSKTIQLNSHYPLGLAYLKSYLEEDWHDVKILFLNDYSYDTALELFLQEVKTFNPDVIGFNILSNNRISSFVLINIIEEFFPNINIVLGGIHVTCMYEQILKNICNKAICVLGEGEMTFKELLSGNELSKIDGIAYYSNNTVIVNKERELIKNLDILPFPNHSIFMNQYRNIVGMITSRGCPFKCSFCVLDSISRRKIRYRSPQNVVDEIEYIYKTFPQIKIIWFHDDNLTLNNQRAIEICKEIIKRNINMSFICSARFKPFSSELIYWMEKAGFTQILFGLESGSEKVLKLSNKKITKAEVKETIKLFENSSLIVTCFLIVGLYGETEETIKETYEFILEIQKIKYIYYEDIGVAAVYPKTELFNIAKEYKKIDENYWLTNEPVPMFEVEYSEEKLLILKEKILDKIAYSRQSKL